MKFPVWKPHQTKIAEKATASLERVSTGVLQLPFDLLTHSPS